MSQLATTTKSTGIAALLSFIIPGAGSMYVDKVGKGFGLLVLTSVAYFLVIPGLILHIISIMTAVNDVKEYNKKG